MSAASTFVALTSKVQGLSAKNSSQLRAMESRQDALQEQMSTVLSTVHSQTETLSELKSMFLQFMTVQQKADSPSPTKSQSPVHQQSRAKVLPLLSAEGLDLPVQKSGTRGKDKENSVDNSIHSADEAEAPASVIPSTKERTAITTEVSPAYEGGDLVDSFLDFDGVGGTEHNAQIAAAEALAEISSPKSDPGADNTIEDSRVGTEVKDIDAPVRQAHSKASTVRKGSPSNQESPGAEVGKELEVEPSSDPYSVALHPHAEQKLPSKAKVTSVVSKSALS